MDKRRPGTMRPVEVKHGPQGIVSFYGSQVLQHEETGLRVLVISASADGQKAILFPLDEPGKPPFEANASWAVGWDDAYLDGPRHVELHKKGADEAIWEAYVPSFGAACALFKYYKSIEGEPFDLWIHTQHVDECQHLEHLGYYGDFSTPEEP